jgi:hypothetical protein
MYDAYICSYIAFELLFKLFFRNASGPCNRFIASCGWCVEISQKVRDGTKLKVPSCKNLRLKVLVLMLDERVRYYHPINFSRINLNSSVEDVDNSMQLAWNLGIHHALLLKVCKWIIRNFVVIAVKETSDIARNDYQLLSRKINVLFMTFWKSD